MLLETISVDALAGLLAPHMHKPPWPGLTRGAASPALKAHARRLGLHAKLARELRTPPEFPRLWRSVYRTFQRTGERAPADRVMREQVRQIQAAALALWLEHPAADAERLQDMIWAQCDQWTWILTAHERCTVDLASSLAGRQLSEIVWMLDKRLEPEVAERAMRVTRERVLDAAWDFRRFDRWQTVRNNWNHVCNANVIAVAFYHLREASTLAAYVHPQLQRMDYALQGFADDGGCHEGPAYWNYGFGHFMDAAVMLHHRTGGRLNLMDGAKIERICRYPLATIIEGPVRTTFADSHDGCIDAASALKVDRFHRVPELFDVCARRADGRPAIAEWRDLALYRGQRATGRLRPSDHLLPDLGQALLRAARGGATLAVLAGNNGVPHNHNDIGSFIYHRHGACLLVDPGAPRYTRKTFSAQRYELLYCRSLGHSVPRINGREQPPGRAHRGELTAAGLNGNAAKSATIDATRAYADPTLRAFTRAFVLAPDGRLTLTDTFEFSRAPRALEEAFVTFEPASVATGGRSVRIGRGRRRIAITCSTSAGRFAVQRLAKETEECQPGAVLSRVVFTPRRLARHMELRFEIG